MYIKMTNDINPNEDIKLKSRGLRGTLAKGMAEQITGSIDPDDQQIIKFHGDYLQDNRDRRIERERKKLEWSYSYMIRLRIPGGDITADQWLGLQESCNRNASGTIKITTRQTIQFHGVVKARMKPTMQTFDLLGLDSIAACGDVNRNVMCGANPALAPYHAEVFSFAEKISSHLLPTTKAFKEVWLDGEKLPDTMDTEVDPLYKDRYLPRKFKVAIAIPPHNENDIFANDIGLIAIGEGDKFLGFNVSVGGGLGTTHGNLETYPRRGTIIGFVPPDQVLEVVWQIAAIQRDEGNRKDRKLSRLKYTIDRVGIDWFKRELEKRCGFTLQEAKPYEFTHRGDSFGWIKDIHGLWSYGIFVENGLVVDKNERNLKSFLTIAAQTTKCPIRFTGNQNVMLVNLTEKQKEEITELLEKYGITNDYSATRKEAIACVALPTCPLALAEGQRYLPSLITKIENLQQKHALDDTAITVRMTGCPNGCARPYFAEVGFVGKKLGKYVMRLGGDYEGERLNQVYKEEVDENEILQILDNLFAEFVKQRKSNERFGDYIHHTYYNNIVFDGKKQASKV
jgi:sulfite reductase (NADPH) hemoprotein beta-component